MMADVFPSLIRQIAEVQENLRLIAERMAWYPEQNLIPLDLVKNKNHFREQLDDLQARLRHLQELPCPYRGLESFDVQHAEFYFGRDAMVQKLLGKLRETNFILVVGPSGSGKSSLVCCGLMAALRAGELDQSTQWDIEVLRPGSDPLRGLAVPLAELLAPGSSPNDRLIEARKLAKSLAEGSLSISDVISELRDSQPTRPRLLLIVDQFEESFTFCKDERVRHSFFGCLLAATEAPWVTVLLTLRADFFGRVLADERLSQRVDRGLINVMPMTVDERRAAIEEPAKHTGRRFEQGLVQRILDAIAGAPGDLPLLEFALTELWLEQTADKVLTHAAYDAIGEVQGAIAKRADETLTDFTVEQQQAVQGIFTRLVQVARPDEAAEDARRRVELAELRPESQDLVRRLADARLLVTGRDPASGEETIEVAHEALIRHWAQLQAWLDRDREFLLWRQRLRTLAGVWADSHRNEAALLPAALLQEAQVRSEGRQGDLSPLEQELLLRSALAANCEMAYWRERAPAVVGKVEAELYGALRAGDPAQAERALRGLVALATPEIVERLAAMVDGDFGDDERSWVDHLGSQHSLRNTALNLHTLAQRRAVQALAKIPLEEATSVLQRWTPPGMVLVPAGAFKMGSNNEQEDEYPEHELQLDAFWLDRYAVTNAQWTAFLAAEPWQQRDLWTEAGWTWHGQVGAEPSEWEQCWKHDHPVRGVCWYEALAHARWAGKVLLSEAQWEKAARGTYGRRYPWGNDFDTEKCNTAKSGIHDTTPVGEYSAKGGDSSCGAADMAGNVLEWCSTLYTIYPYRAADGEDLERLGSRVLRGGSFLSAEGDARCGCRYSHDDPDRRHSIYGVRVGISPEQLTFGSPERPK